jgi:hypothetical protein
VLGALGGPGLPAFLSVSAGVGLGHALCGVAFGLFFRCSDGVLGLVCGACTMLPFLKTSPIMLHSFLSKNANGSGSKTTPPSLFAAHSVPDEFVRKIL